MNVIIFLFICVIDFILTELPDKEYQSLLYFPLVQSNQNPNYYELSLLIDEQEYNLPINLNNNSIALPFNEKVATTELLSSSTQSLFEDFSCIEHSSSVTIKEIVLTTANNVKITLNYVPYQSVDKYKSQCNYRQYLGLSKSNLFITMLQEQNSKVVKANEFSISLDNNGKGLLLIGEHMEMLKGVDPLFCRPIEEPTAQGRWGCQIRGSILEENLQTFAKNGLLNIDTNLRSGKEYFLTSKKTAASDKYQHFYFDMNFQYILTTYKFLVYLKNFYFKKSISDNICEIRNNTSLNILAFYCNKEIFTSLQPIHFLIGYHTIKFVPEDLFILDKSSNNEKEYLFQIVGRNNKKGSDWLFGHPLFKRYTVMFNHDAQMIYIFSKNLPPTVSVQYTYYPVKSSSVPDIEIDVEEDLFDVNINGQSDEIGIDLEKKMFNRKKLVSFSIGMVCFIGIFYLLYFKISYTKVKKNIVNTDINY